VRYAFESSSEATCTDLRLPVTKRDWVQERRFEQGIKRLKRVAYVGTPAQYANVDHQSPSA